MVITNTRIPISANLAGWLRNVAALLIVGCVGGTANDSGPFEGDDAGECSDGADNDRDGDFDCADTDCAGAVSCQNTPPSSPTITITPADPFDDDDLACSIVSQSSDSDNDPIVYIYSWKKDGNTTAFDEATVPADASSPGETWTCTVIAFDGDSNSDPATASVEIRNDRPVDVLLVVDASTSVTGELIAFSAHVDLLLEELNSVDTQIAITTSDVATTYGDLAGNTRILIDDDLTPVQLARSILCDAACSIDTASLTNDPDFECTEDVGLMEQPSVQYLDCLCGGDSWNDETCGAGVEEPLEAQFMAMCRAEDDPPEACFGPENQFDDSDIASNAGMLRHGSVLATVWITDEGDSSRRLSQGEGDPQTYVDLFSEFDHLLSYFAIGPNLECNSGSATSWGVERFETLVNQTSGAYFLIEEGTPPDECAMADFAFIQQGLGEALAQASAQ